MVKDNQNTPQEAVPEHIPQTRKATFHCSTCGRYSDVQVPVGLGPHGYPLDDHGSQWHIGFVCEHRDDEGCDDPDLREIREGDAIRVYLNAYDTYQMRGGPEEGGWYYECGLPLGSVPMRATVGRDEYGRTRGIPDKDFVAEAKDILTRGTGDSYNDPRFLIETHSARAYPTRRPHYE